jgi:tetratricopeptide (TPR) repeat protein
LLKEMRSPGLTVEEIFNRTRIGVSRVSKSEQVPWISSSLIDEYYLGKAAGPVASDPKPLPKDSDVDMRRDYDFAERLGTKKGWEDFLARYRTGPLPDLARDKLAKLDEKVTPAAPPPRPEPKPDTQAKVEPTKPLGTEPLVQELDRQIEQNPNDPDGYFKRGLAHAQKGRYSQAIKDFDQVIRLNSKDSEAFNNRCWARAMLGDLQVALRDCNESLRLKPNFVDALDSRGLVNLKIGLPNSAIADYNAALRLNPKHASALFGRGKAKLRNGDTSGGNADIEAAKAINRDIAREFEDYGIK